MPKIARTDPENVDVRRKEHRLPMQLTEKEIMAKARELASVIREKNRLEFEKSETGKFYKTQIDSKEIEMRDLISIIEKGEENRPVSCEEFHDFGEGLVTIIRLDTGEHVGQRTMTAHERQVDLAGKEE